MTNDLRHDAITYVYTVLSQFFITGVFHPHLHPASLPFLPPCPSTLNFSRRIVVRPARKIYSILHESIRITVCVVMVTT